MMRSSINIIKIVQKNVHKNDCYQLIPVYSIIPSSQQKREIHSTRPKESLIAGGIGVLIFSVGANQLYKHFKSPQSSLPTTPSSSTDKTSTGTNTQQTSTQSQGFFASFFARNFYDGGFEDKMTKREAALILGVRESAKIERIKDAHRKILLLNHPDRGGSAFIAAKVNEAKDLLMKGKS